MAFAADAAVGGPAKPRRPNAGVAASGEGASAWTGPVEAMRQPSAEPIRIELRRGATVVNIAWPAATAGDCAAWLRELLR